MDNPVWFDQYGGLGRWEGVEPEAQNDDEDTDRDTTPICWACGQVEEWTGEYREIELEGGMFTVYDPVYECRNPECSDLEEE